MSGASLLFAESKIPLDGTTGNASGSTGIDAMLSQFDRVIACETGVQSRPVYEYAVPRGNVGVIVGNERNGITGKILKKVHQVISIPMLGKGLSSVNVAVAAAIVLYVAQRDFGRKRLRPVALSHRDVEILAIAPSDPSELGSFLHSAWAFGWQRVFLADPGGTWFTNDQADPSTTRPTHDTTPLKERYFMTPKKKPSRKEMISVCNEIHPDDGVDPREIARKGRPLRPTLIFRVL